MAGKHRKANITRTPTKHQVSKWKKEQRLSRIIGIVTGVVIAAVLGIIGYWYYSEQVMPYQQTVIKVNDKSYSMDYFIKALDFYSQGQTADVTKLYVDMVAQSIPQDQVAIDNAAAANITVSDDEITKRLEEMKLSRNDFTVDAVKTIIVAQKYMEQQCVPNLPAPMEQVEAQAMFLETKSMAEDRRQRLVQGDNFTTLAGLLSLEPVTQGKRGYLGWIPRGYEDRVLGTLKDSVLKNLLFNLDVVTISDPVYDENVEKPFGYWVLEVLEKDDAKGIHARGILFSSEDDAKMVRERLLNGESWDDLARQYSQHTSKDKGGDLDWIVPGVDSTQVGKILSTLEVKQISPVIRDDSQKTKGGYWLAQVLDKQVRPLDASIAQSLKEECVTAWMQGLLKQAKIENTLDQKQKDFAVDQVMKKRSQ
ncbi:MAG: peptidylprolyl isomerase [Dehalococcoidia bacterium]|nr:peptidylprolyl isomerase [Dehalococcoidia bacterium]